MEQTRILSVKKKPHFRTLTNTKGQLESWNDHISSSLSKANSTLGFVKRNVKTSNIKVKEMAYKTLVRPQGEYASPVWSPHIKENIDKIEMTQKELLDG